MVGEVAADASDAALGPWAAQANVGQLEDRVIGRAADRVDHTLSGVECPRAGLNELPQARWQRRVGTLQIKDSIADPRADACLIPEYHDPHRVAIVPPGVGGHSFCAHSAAVIQDSES